MSKVLVLGDQITDQYEFYTATRLCPEGPVPVLVKSEDSRSSHGGGALVAAQLRALMGDESVHTLFGSQSIKKRIFADDHLMLRIDQDSEWVIDQDNHKRDIRQYLDEEKFDAIIISDYNKGAMTKELAQWVIDQKIPVFADAKQNWSWYTNAFAYFPNEHESAAGMQHVIRKLGKDGCLIDAEHHIPTESRQVRDVCGAGDIFLAAFVYHWLTGTHIEVAGQKFPYFFIPGTEEKVQLELAARYANKVAGISVEYLGTHVVTQEEIDKS